MRYFFWIFLISLVIFRYFTTRPVYKNGQKIKITGVVYSDPIFFGKDEFVKLGNLRMYLAKEDDVEYGDKITVKGIVQNGELKNAEFMKKEEGNFLAGFRNKIIDFYQKSLPQPESGLLGGIVFGARGAMLPDFYNQTKVSGLFHLVIPSGLKTTLVISFLIGFFTLFLKRKLAIPFAILGIIVYILVSGLDAPIVRAGLMAMTAFSAQIVGRVVDPWRTFFLTAGVMLVIFPDWILDIGFYISFASVAFLILYKKEIAEALKFLPKIIKEDLSASLAAQIGAAPILYLAFNQISFWSPVANTLVLWVVPFLMAAGIVGGTVGLVLPGVGRIILLAVYPPLWFFAKIVGIFGS